MSPRGWMILLVFCAQLLAANEEALMLCHLCNPEVIISLLGGWRIPHLLISHARFFIQGCLFHIMENPQKSKSWVAF